MSRFSRISRGSALTSRIRQERDVVAACVHLLGYWPRNSLVLVVTDRQGIGPLIRVDLANPHEISVEDYLDTSFGAVPPPGRQEKAARRVFVLIFGESVNIYPGISSCELYQPVDAGDQLLYEYASQYLKPIGTVSSLHEIEVLDVIVVGQAAYWSINPETDNLEPAGWVSDIFSSPVYAELISRGSVVSRSSQESYDTKKWNPLDTCDSGDTERWLTASEIAVNQYLEKKQKTLLHELFQAEAELILWDRVLEAALPLLAPESEGDLQFSTLGDRLRSLLLPDTAGYLVASLASSATLNYLIYLACTDLSRTLDALGLLGEYFLEGEVPSYRRVLPSRETLSAFDLGTLKSTSHAESLCRPDDCDAAGMHFAAMLAGISKTPPAWGRLESLERICALLENVACEKTEAMLIAAQAWVKWLRGSSTDASHILESLAPQYVDDSPLLIYDLLGNSVIPAWLRQPGGAPPAC